MGRTRSRGWGDSFSKGIQHLGAILESLATPGQLFECRPDVALQLFVVTRAQWRCSAPRDQCQPEQQRFRRSQQRMTNPDKRFGKSIA